MKVVVVVGAGLGGLGAAMRLQGARHDERETGAIGAAIDGAVVADLVGTP